MMSLQTSRDGDGVFEMDEMEELLREDDFDGQDTGSDRSEEDIYQQSIRRRKKYLQNNIPLDSFEGKILQRLEDEGSPIPFYIHWPWPKIRKCFSGLFLIVWIAVTVGAIWPIVRIMLFPGTCTNSEAGSREWWLAGPILNVDLEPDQSLMLVEDDAAEALREEYGVMAIKLSSPAWWTVISAADASSPLTLATDIVRRISEVCEARRLKLVLSVFLKNATQLVNAKKNSRSLGRTLDDTTEPVLHLDAMDDQLMIYQSLITAGVDGFYLEDTESLTLEETEEVMNFLKRAKNLSDADVFFGMNYNPFATSPPVAVAGVSSDSLRSYSSSPSNLSRWIEVHLKHGTKPAALWTPPSQSLGGGEMEDDFARKLRLLQILLPGIPMVDSTELDDFGVPGSDDSPLQTLLRLRERSPTLREGSFSSLESYDHLQEDVFAVLRTYEESERYLIVWNFGDSTVSLDFRSLSMQGRWVYRSAASGHPDPSVKMGHVDGVQPHEFGVIELP